MHSAIALLLLSLAGPRWPDADSLAYIADSAGIRRDIVFAIAWEETASNTNPHIRGHHCWNLLIRDPNCEVGRFQIKPSTAKLRCSGYNIWTWQGNSRCFVKMFNEDLLQGYAHAIRRHNGRGPKADAYLKRVLYTVGLLSVVYD